MNFLDMVKFNSSDPTCAASYEHQRRVSQAPKLSPITYQRSDYKRQRRVLPSTSVAS